MNVCTCIASGISSSSKNSSYICFFEAEKKNTISLRMNCWMFCVFALVWQMDVLYGFCVFFCLLWLDPAWFIILMGICMSVHQFYVCMFFVFICMNLLLVWQFCWFLFYWRFYFVFYVGWYFGLQNGWAFPFGLWERVWWERRALSHQIKPFLVRFGKKGKEPIKKYSSCIFLFISYQITLSKWVIW